MHRSTFLAGVAFAALPLAAPAERTPEEWREELGKRYEAAGSFVATYVAETPGKPAAKVTLARERESGGGLVRFELEPGEATTWFEPHGEGGRYYYRAGDETREIRGFAELITMLDRIKAIFNDDSPEDEMASTFEPYFHLERESFNLGVRAVSAVNGAPWFDRELLDRIDTINERDGEVHLKLTDGEAYTADAETGLLVKQTIQLEEGLRELRLESRRVLPDAAAFRALCPEVDPDNVKEANVGDTNFAWRLHAVLYQFLALAGSAEGVTVEDLDGQLKERREQFIKYWSVSLQGDLPAGFPPDMGDSLMEELVPKIRERIMKEAAERRPEFVDELKKVTDEQILKLVRSVFVEGLAEVFAAKAEQVPGLKKMKGFLEAQSNQGGAEGEVGELIVRHLFATYLEAVAGVVVDKAGKANFE